jgi:hypothetical protein
MANVRDKDAKPRKPNSSTIHLSQENQGKLLAHKTNIAARAVLFCIIL